MWGHIHTVCVVEAVERSLLTWKMASLVIQYLIKWWREGRTSAVKSTFGSLSSLDLYTFLSTVVVAYLDRRCMEQRELMGFGMLSLLLYL